MNADIVWKHIARIQCGHGKAWDEIGMSGYRLAAELAGNTTGANVAV
jgi:hypothetical protein